MLQSPLHNPLRHRRSDQPACVCVKMPCARGARRVGGLPLLLLFAGLLCLAASSSDSEAPAGASWVLRPHRVHLEPTPDPTEMLVWWMSPVESQRSIVQYGFSRSILDFYAENLEPAQRHVVEPSAGSSERSSSDDGGDDRGYVSEYINTVRLTALPSIPGVRIFYRVGSWRSGWSPVRSFTTRGAGADRPVRIAVFGDQVRGAPSLRLMPGCRRCC